MPISKCLIAVLLALGFSALADEPSRLTPEDLSKQYALAQASLREFQNYRDFDQTPSPIAPLVVYSKLKFTLGIIANFGATLRDTNLSDGQKKHMEIQCAELIDEVFWLKLGLGAIEDNSLKERLSKFVLAFTDEINELATEPAGRELVLRTLKAADSDGRLERDVEQRARQARSSRNKYAAFALAALPTMIYIASLHDQVSNVMTVVMALAGAWVTREFIRNKKLFPLMLAAIDDVADFNQSCRNLLKSKDDQ